MRFSIKWPRALLLAALALVIVVPWTVLASSVDESIVDTTSPVGSVTLAPGVAASITINLTVTGKQEGTATFQVNRDWALSGGTFSGSNPQEFTVNPRAAQDAATTFSTSGTVTVAAGQAAGTFTLAVGAFGITNDNPTGAKLAVGAKSNYQVIVSAPADTTPPVITVPADMTVEATSSSGAVVTFTVSAFDAVDGAVTATAIPASGSTFPLGETTVNVSASDSHGNTATATFKVTVVDTTPPTITSHPSDMTVEATSKAGAVVTFGEGTASDLVDGNVAVVFDPASGSTFALGSTTVTGTAIDAHGNKATCSFTVTVQDTTPPTISGLHDITVHATANGQATVNFTATASDLVDGNVPVVFSPASGSLFSIGTTTVMATATDSHGNKATATFKVTVDYAFTGFFAPVDNPGTGAKPMINAAKAGSAIPVKFSLGGNQGLGIFAANFPRWYAIGDSGWLTSAPTDDINVTVTANKSGLTYDALTGQYTYVWKTEKAWKGFYQLIIQLNDGTEHTAYFNLK